MEASSVQYTINRVVVVVVIIMDYISASVWSNIMMIVSSAIIYNEY